MGGRRLRGPSPSLTRGICFLVGLSLQIHEPATNHCRRLMCSFMGPSLLKNQYKAYFVCCLIQSPTFHRTVWQTRFSKMERHNCTSTNPVKSPGFRRTLSFLLHDKICSSERAKGLGACISDALIEVLDSRLEKLNLHEKRDNRQQVQDMDSGDYGERW
ncbi:hypothetical protein BC830DRAFT_1138355 [Chytriomyces sp. MP71]|nr:hypothetical protein BC830DRAFT_1138355 [Chytriomyces sp. MP71]